MKTTITIDRVEENFVVIETSNQKMLDIPKDFFPFDVKEGRKYDIEFNLLPEDKSIDTEFHNLFKKKKNKESE